LAGRIWALRGITKIVFSVNLIVVVFLIFLIFSGRSRRTTSFFRLSVGVVVEKKSKGVGIIFKKECHFNA
jgi:hypothetical protein